MDRNTDWLRRNRELLAEWLGSEELSWETAADPAGLTAPAAGEDPEEGRLRTEGSRPEAPGPSAARRVAASAALPDFFRRSRELEQTVSRGFLPLREALRKEEGQRQAARREAENLPEPGWSPAELSALWERDSRRYDGGFPLL